MSDLGLAELKFAPKPAVCGAEECHKLSSEIQPGRAAVLAPVSSGPCRSTQPAELGELSAGPESEPAIEGAPERSVAGVKRGRPESRVPEESHQTSNPDVQTEQRKLAVADWSPFNGAPAGGSPEQEAGQTIENGFQGPAKRAARRPLGQNHSPQQQQARSQSRSSSEATESDSEKDAAEVYVSKFRQQAHGSPAKPRQKKRKSPLPKAGCSPKKMARRSSYGEDRRRSDDEVDAIVALEQIKNAGPALLNKTAPSAPLPVTSKAALPQAALLDAASRFPAGALEALARLVQQQPMPLNLRSPFQGQPASPPQPPAAGQVSMGLMRTCFSETSAEKLVAKVKQEQSALSNLQSIVETSNGKRGNDLAQQPAPNFSQVKGRAASGPLPGLPPSNFPTVASDTATDAVFNLSSVLGHNTKPLSSAFLQQGSAEPQPSISAAAISKANLGAFGSIISSAMGSQLRKAVEAPTGEKAAAASEEKRNSSLPPLERGPKAGTPPATSQPAGGQARLSKPSSAVPAPGSAHTAAKGPGALSLPTGMPSTIAGPDPRILDWVLGNRGSLTDRGKNHLAKSGAPASSPGFEALFPRPSAPVKPESESPMPGNPTSSTLRRPIARRASEMQEGLQSRARPEAVLETILSRMHANALPSPPSNLETMPAVSAKLAELASAAQHTLSAGDVGRVMQWAATELALRDQKVREADKLREEERRAHDAAMNAVGTEVARLKRGQAELAITHWKLQEALSQKDAELREKCKLVQQLSAGITEITQQGIFAAKEAQSLRSDCGAMQSFLQTQTTQILTELNVLEEALNSSNASNALALVSGWRDRLEQSSKDMQRTPLPPTSRQ